MKPSHAFAAVANLLTQIVGKSYRDEPLTDEEWDRWTDKILLLAAKEKEHGRADKQS
jgi:hypothetical protein